MSVNSGHNITQGYTQDLVLKNKFVTLIPHNVIDDPDYFLSLILRNKYNTLNEQELRGHLQDICPNFFWYVYNNSVPSKPVGVIYLSYYDGIGWSLDAYKDDRVFSFAGLSYMAGKLVLDYGIKNVTEEIWTCHDTRNKPATRLVLLLGFRHVKDVPAGDITFALFRYIPPEDDMTVYEDIDEKRLRNNA